MACAKRSKRALWLSHGQENILDLRWLELQKLTSTYTQANPLDDNMKDLQRQMHQLDHDDLPEQDKARLYQ